MKYIFCALIISFSFISNAKKQVITPAEYIATYKDDAIKEMKRTGIPASITLAQGMLESGNGNSRLARKANNHFGIKCHSDWDGPSIRKDDDAKRECFRKYKNAWESYRDHSNFLVNRKRYAFLFDLRLQDYKGWAKGLKKAGYATNPKYPSLLINLIEKYDLHQYDSRKARKKRKKKAAEKEEEEETPTSKRKSKKDKKKKRHQPKEEVRIAKRIQVSKNYVKFLVVKKGDTYYSLERETGIHIKRLKKYNEKKDNNLKLGERIYLQPKKKSFPKKYHVVKKGETIYSISQKYGVSAKSIVKRNKISPSSTLKAGQKIKLKGRAVTL